ncbi:hsp90 co-chaperone Cdc37 [Linderina macrospora]|uniref:Hsp90 co-chaperone Cdc37 n=1 Tax=Linderina macrospora TaxID=4868 RepID=A0ACC1JB96_9FUNG|nr:hsp90 co-chaperone Cdc37 [Linderina macrospora]
MPIDYSKWDNLELSDDSDVEVHPNIERNTFIRLRQRKIREERENRRLRRERIETMIPMNKDLIERITALRTRITDANEDSLKQIMQEWEKDVEKARVAKEARDSVTNQGKIPEQPSKDEMMDALKARISDDLLKEAAGQGSVLEKQSALAKQLDSHIAKLNESLKSAEDELKEVKLEEAKHIDPSTIAQSGFDRSFVSKSEGSSSKAKKPATRTVKDTATTYEVLNPGSVGKFDTDAGAEADAEEDYSEDMDEEGNLRLDADSRKFASLKTMSESFDFISKNLSIVSEKKADQILGYAFTLQLEDKGSMSRQYVHQSLILTYIMQMGPSGVRMFFDRVGAPGRAQEMFKNDVDARYKHIVERCKVIKSEREQYAEPEVESIQLQCDDPDAPIRISVPDESNPEEDQERIKLFNSMPVAFQEALKEGTLEAVNKVLATIPGPEAEQLLGVCGQGSFLVIDGEIVVDPNEEPGKQ